MRNCHHVKAGGLRLGARFQKYFRSLLISLTLCVPCVGSANPSSGTAPFIFDANRIYAELAFIRPDGTLRKTLVFVDLGSPSTILSEALFNELQLDKKTPLTFKVGEMPVRIDPSAVTSDTWLPYSVGDNRRVEALLPAGVMQKYEVVIDYASHVDARTPELKPKGAPLIRVNENTGLIVSISPSMGRRIRLRSTTGRPTPGSEELLSRNGLPCTQTGNEA